MPLKKLIVCILIVCFCTSSNAQKKLDTAFFMSNYRLGNQHFSSSPDSAYFFFKKANEWRLKNSYFDTSVHVSSMLSNLGRTCRVLAKPQEAQTYLNAALTNARKNKHQSVIKLIYIRLAILHKNIIENNWSFQYPSIAQTETQEVYFPISSVKPYGKDSLEIIVAAGRLDGIVNDSQTCRINSRVIEKDTLHHTSVNTITTANIFILNDNSCILHVSNAFSEQILEKDFLTCYAEVPIRWNELLFKNLLLTNILFRDNKDDYFNYRYFYYYGTSQTEKELIDAMLADGIAAAKIVAPDTLTNPDRAYKLESGIFKGFNMFRALIESKPAHAKLFLEYINMYPGNVMGNIPDFTLSYLSWIAYGSEINPSAIEKYFEEISTDSVYTIVQAKNLFQQIKSSGLYETWLGYAMQAINDENFDVAKKYAWLINTVVTANADTLTYGWYEYIIANVYHKQTNLKMAKMLLDQADLLFVKYKNFEGITWVNATKEKWQEPLKLTIGMQNGHTKFFITAISPNAKYFATGGHDNNIVIWNKLTGKEVTTLYYHKGAVTSLHYSPNGRYLVSASEDKQLVVWNAYNYTVLTSYTTDGLVNVAKFSPNSKLLYVAEDSILSIVNPFVDTTMVVQKIKLHDAIINDIIFYRNNPNLIYSCGDDSTVKLWNLKTEKVTRTFSNFGNVKSIALSPTDSRYLAMVNDEGTYRIYDLFVGESNNVRQAYLEVNGYSKKFAAMYACHSFSPDGKYASFVCARDSIRIINLSDMYSRKYQVDIDKFRLRNVLFTNDNQDLLITSNGYSFKLINFSDYDFNKRYQLNVKSIHFYNNQINRVGYIGNSKLQYYAFGGIYGTLDLATGKAFAGIGESDVNLPSPKHITYSGDSTLVLIYQNNYLMWFNKNTDSLLVILNKPTNENLESYDCTISKDTLFATTAEGTVIGYSFKTLKEFFRVKIDTDTSYMTMQPFYNKYNNKVYIKAKSNAIYVLNVSNGIVEDTLLAYTTRHIAFSKDKVFVTTGNGVLNVYNFSGDYITGWELNNAKQDAMCVEVVPNTNYVLVQHTPTGVALLDIIKEEFVYRKTDHPFGTKSLSLSPDGKEFATGGFDGSVHIYETLTGNKKATIKFPFKKDPIIIDSNNYYMVSKSSLNAVNLYYNNNVYPYDQFDVQLNRPDKVLQTLGYADSAIVKAYYNAYQKRIKNQNLTDQPFTNNLHLPTVKILNKYVLRTSTPNNEFKISLSCSDEKYPLKSVHILVNNTPVLGVAGKRMTQLNVHQLNDTFTIPLAKGANQIKVYCVNSNGVSSLKETFNVSSTYTDTTHQPTVYFVGIGVAKYKDSTMNLTYSVKDIRDLAAKFGTRFKYCIIDTLIDKNVTRENILAINKKLQKTTPNDRVIIAVTGHGLLSDSLDFYYATYDVDFNKPEKRGLKYNLLEALFDHVPAHEKALFIDACHSGALDKEELIALERKRKIAMHGKNTSNVSGIASRSSILVKNKKKNVNAANSFELMQNSFSDLSESTGAVIISAAGGMEYAFESAEWNNGVFTYSIIEGLFNKDADQYYGGNKDEEVSIQELAIYVSKRVSQLTNEKQKPTSRKENLDFNWIINF